MGYAIIAWDGTDKDALDRRMAVRDRHIAVITRWAEQGRLSLGFPTFRADGSVAGSIMILGEEDEVGAKEYLQEEPFAREGVWQSYEARPFRIAPLPYQPLPTSGPTPPRPTHSVIIAEDGTDAGALARRMAAREAHMKRVSGLAADGTLALGGALLNAKGEMTGSIAITRHPTEEEARAFWAEDPYVQQKVWQKMQYFVTRFAPLPYKALPQPA
ncbi:YciI family protein [Roseococcus sp. YIM B11640]|uniref:YciI family protein n=1 Tax=Roseococcus sp. YIM B11640 TaxID=3133973 RepID=UPI003C7B3887